MCDLCNVTNVVDNKNFQVFSNPTSSIYLSKLLNILKKLVKKHSFRVGNSNNLACMLIVSFIYEAMILFHVAKRHSKS
jgi:hypothetical protein